MNTRCHGRFRQVARALQVAPRKSLNIKCLQGRPVGVSGRTRRIITALAATGRERYRPAALIYGYYQQRPVFIEPMIANATLLAGKGFTLPVAAAPGQAASVHTPAAFRADWDSAGARYRFVFTAAKAGGK